MDAKKLHQIWCPMRPDCTGNCGFAKDIALLVRDLDDPGPAGELQRLREALSNLLRLFAGYSIDTHEVGFCTVQPSDRRWIDEARRVMEG